MGNCIRKDSDSDYDYGESPAISPEKTLISGDPRRGIRKRAVAGDEYSGDRCSSGGGKSPTTTTEVKIKITKKQLEELLCVKEMQGLTLEQVLTRLMNGGDEVLRSDRRSWRPALESIPE